MTATVAAHPVPTPLRPPPFRHHPVDLLSAQVASLSRAAPYAVPTGGFDTEVIRLVSGAPAAEALPLADYAHVAATLLNDPVAGPEALGYGPHSGIPELREWIADREGVTADRVLVTNGGLHGVSLAFAALLEPGDSIGVDDPVFPDTMRIAELHSARVLPVPVGAHGLDVDALAWRLRSGQRIKVLYTVPDFHNPSGGVLPAAAARPAGRTRRGVRIRHRLRQSLPRIRFRRPAGARLLRRFRPGGPGRDLHQDPGTRPSARLGRRPGLAGAAPGEPPPPLGFSFLGARASG